MLSGERARVLDFGLAHVDAGEAGPRGGTRAYMAPELFEPTGRSSVRSDQFAFCVALWEALYQERPYARRDFQAGVPGAPAATSGGRVPGVLRKALVQGLAPNPDDRFASLVPLIEALEYQPPWGRRMAVGLIGIALAAGAWLGVEQVERQQQRAECASLAAGLEGVWNGEVQSRIGERFAASSQAFANEAWARAIPGLDAWAESWSEQRGKLCTEAELERSWNVSDEANARECLAVHEAEFTALLEVFADIDDAMIPRALPLVARLGDPSECLDPARISHRLTPDLPWERAKVLELRARSIRIAMLNAGGRHDEALTLAEALVEEARALDWAPALAESLTMLGLVRHHGGELDDARALHEQSFFMALELGHDELAARASVAVLGILIKLAERDTIEYWIRTSETLLARVGLDKGVEAGSRLLNLSAYFYDQERHDEALEALRRCIEIWERKLGPEHPDLAIALNNLGIQLRETGAEVEALDIARRAHETLVAGYGPDHHLVAVSSINIGDSYRKLGRFEASLPYYTDAEALLERAFGTEDTRIATAFNNHALSLLRLGRVDEALALHRRSLAIREAVDPKHPRMLSALGNVSQLLMLKGSFDEALEFGERCRALAEEVLPEGHSRLATCEAIVGRILHHMGRDADALPMLARATEINAAAEHRDPQLATGRLFLARVEARLGHDPARVQTLLEQSIAGFESLPAPLPDAQLARAELGRVRYLLGELAARAEVVAVRDALRKANDAGDPGGALRRELPEIEAWLAEQPQSAAGPPVSAADG